MKKAGRFALFHLCLTYLDVTGAVGVGGAVEAVGVVGVVGVGGAVGVAVGAVVEMVG